MEEVVDAEVAHLGLEAGPQVEDRLRTARCKFGGLLDWHVGGLARAAACAEQLLGADQRHVEKLARQVFEPGIA